MFSSQKPKKAEYQNSNIKIKNIVKIEYTDGSIQKGEVVFPNSSININ